MEGIVRFAWQWCKWLPASSQDTWLLKGGQVECKSAWAVPSGGLGFRCASVVCSGTPLWQGRPLQSGMRIEDWSSLLCLLKQHRQKTRQATNCHINASRTPQISWVLLHAQNVSQVFRQLRQSRGEQRRPQTKTGLVAQLRLRCSCLSATGFVLLVFSAQGMSVTNQNARAIRRQAKTGQPQRTLDPAQGISPQWVPQTPKRGRSYPVRSTAPLP